MAFKNNTCWPNRTSPLPSLCYLIKAGNDVYYYMKLNACLGFHLYLLSLQILSPSHTLEFFCATAIFIPISVKLLNEYKIKGKHDTITKAKTPV
jgi:hypothetical protein